MRSVVLILLVGLLFSSISFLTVFANPSIPQVYVVGFGWGNPQNPVNAHPGYTEFPFYVEITASSGATPTGASLSLPFNSPFIMTNGNQAGLSQATGYYLATFYLTIPSSTSPGYYSAKVTVDYSVQINGYYCTESKTFNLEIPVYAVNFPLPVAIQGGSSTTSEQLMTGEGLAPVTLTVSNPSNHIVDNVIVNLTLPSGLLSQTGQRYLTFTIPAIPSQESIQSTQLVNVTNNAMPGIYTINYSESFINYLGYKYYATNSNITSGNANLTVTNVPLNLAIYPKTPLIVTLSSPSATPSSTVSVLLGLNTTYNSFIESISPQTQLTLLSSNFTSTTFKGREVFNYTFEIPQNLVPGFYPVTFNVNYQIFGQQEQTTITTFVHVGYYNVSPILSDPIWGGQSNQVIPTPGMTGIPLTLTLINPLPYSLSNVNVTFILPPGMSSPYTSYVIPSIGASGSGENSAQIALTVNLAQNLSPGYHNINYVITYTSSYGISVVKSTIPVYIYPTSQISVSLGNTTLYQGTQSIFPVVISDTGIAPISQVSISLKTEGVSVIGFTNQTLNSLQPGANSTFLFTLSAQGISPGTYPVILTLTYNYEGQLKTSSYTVPINVLPSEDIVQVSVIPSEVFYGEINNVTIQLRDTASLPVSDVELRLFGQPSLYSLSQNIINLGTLDPGKIYEVSLNLLPTVTSNTPLPLSVEVQYLIPGGGVVSQAYNFSLVATGLVDLVLQQPQVSFSNGSLTVTGILNNFGTASANFVTVYVNGNSTYIGSVPPNSPTPFSTTLFLPFINGSIHQHEIKIVISYEDSIYQPHNITYFINYTPAATQFNVTGFHNFHNFQRRNSILPEIIIFILIVVVIILAILLVLRRGKR